MTKNVFCTGIYHKTAHIVYLIDTGTLMLPDTGNDLSKLYIPVPVSYINNDF